MRKWIKFAKNIPLMIYVKEYPKSEKNETFCVFDLKNAPTFAPVFKITVCEKHIKV